VRAVDSPSCLTKSGGLWCLTSVEGFIYPSTAHQCTLSIGSHRIPCSWLCRSSQDMFMVATVGSLLLAVLLLVGILLFARKQRLLFIPGPESAQR
jgi:hypothetical protein